MPTFTVIIPTYNRKKYVVKAIDSVLAQSCKDYEIIVIDDGSVDNTEAALGAYRQKIHYLRQQNSGVSAARNTGIRAARGRWISFLDSDDEWCDFYLSTQLFHIERYPAAVAHITNSSYIFANGTRGLSHFEDTRMLAKFGRRSSLLFERPFSVVIDHVHWFLQASIIRRDILLKVGLLDPRLSIVEDMDLLARVALAGPISFCREELVEIHTREESTEKLSSQWIHKGLSSRQTFGAVYTKFLKLEGLSVLDRLTAARVLSVNWRAIGNILIKDNRKTEGRSYYRKSFLLYPSAKSLIKYLATLMPQRLSVLLVRKGTKIVPR